MRAGGRVLRRKIDSSVGLPDYLVRYVARFLGLGRVQSLRQVLDGMKEIMDKCDATLVEINPLVQAGGGLAALDAKIVLDDKARFRHADLFARLEAEQERYLLRARTKAEALAAKYGITFVPMNGELAVISDGAGTGMLTLDLIGDLGLRAANFCELGGLANAETMTRAMEVAFADPQVRVLLVTLIGGLTRMDDMAEGIVAYKKKTDIPMPIAIRMCGTQEEEGRAILGREGLDASTDLGSSLERAAALVGSGRP